MKKIFALLAAAACLFLAASCSKNNTPPVYDNYSQLKLGNYWIYQLYDVDSAGNGTPLNIYDSCYVSKDTTINGNTYWYLQSSNLLGSPTYNKWLRDSLHYIVDHTGRIYFSYEDFSTVFYKDNIVIGSDIVASVEEKMDFTYLPVTTPAGTFHVYDCKTTYMLQPPFDLFGKQRYIHRRYAKNIGIVSEVLPFYISSPRYLERKLVRYSLH